MRGTMLIGLAVVLLIIGILTIKNMGADNSSSVEESQAEEYLDKAQTTVDDVNERLKGLKKKTRAVD